MADRPAKLQRLEDLKRSVPHVSGRALTAILHRVRAAGLPELTSRKNQQDARDTLAYKETPFGPMQRTADLVGADGRLIRLHVTNPHAILHQTAVQGGSFSTFLQHRLVERPPSQLVPWHLILYSDGITPGDAFRTGNERKLEAVYFSLLELGMAALSQEDAWFTLVGKRSVEVAKVGGLMSQVIGTCLKQFFTGPHDLRSGGMLLTFPDGERVMLFVVLSIFVQDELAHKQTWCCKGAAGTRSCMACLDYADLDSDLAMFDETNFIRSEILDPYALVMHTDESIRVIVRRLQASHAVDAVGVFALREKALGFNHDIHNVLLDGSLDEIVHPISQYMHDWMHVVMVGIFQAVLFLVMEKLRGIIRYASVDEYLRVWHWPRQFGGASNCAKKAFDQKHETASRKAKTFKCSASEGLSVFPVVAHYFRKALLPHASAAEGDAIRVFLALVVVIELLQNVARGSVTPAALRNAIFSFMGLYVALFGWSTITKFHALLHLVWELTHHGCLLSCWVHERKHKSLKAFAQNIMSGTAYESSLLSEVTCAHLHALRTEDTFNFQIGLLKRRATTPEIRATVADIFHCEDVVEGLESRFDAFSICSRGDVVLFRDEGGFTAGEIRRNLEIGGVPVSVVDLFAPVEMHIDQQYCVWRSHDDPKFVETESIIANLIWTRTDDIITTLLPRR